MVSKNPTELNRRWANQKPSMASQDLAKTRYVLALILLICCPTRSEDKMSPTLFDDEEFGGGAISSGEEPEYQDLDILDLDYQDTTDNSAIPKIEIKIDVAVGSSESKMKPTQQSQEGR